MELWEKECLQAVERFTKTRHPAVAAIDDRCGSGKTRLGKILKQEFSCNLVHMDDFYLPFSEREPDWKQNPGGNMDFLRFRKEILEPSCAELPIAYRAFDCHANTYCEQVAMPACPLTIVEGSYSHHPMLADCYTLRIFLTCSKEEQLRRLRRREGERLEWFQSLWIPLEEQYFERYGIEAASNMVFDTTGRE
ncbi:MAG: uridine kinase [Butyricicoccus pullicaecorum]|jgi:uridine kinase|nr:uridine kinase [Butyricicoccus pullicaecorum]